MNLCQELIFKWKNSDLIPLEIIYQYLLIIIVLCFVLFFFPQRLSETSAVPQMVSEKHFLNYSTVNL